METSTELIKKNEVLGTPFTIITVEEGSFIAMGRYRLTDYLDEDQCMERILSKDWELIIQLVTILLNHQNPMQQNEQ